jgi:hypothetical protein
VGAPAIAGRVCASSAPDGSPDVRRNRPSGRPGLLACPRPRAFRHSRPDPRLAASTLLPLLPGVASPPFSGHGVHWGAVPAALIRDPPLNGATPAGVLSSPAGVDSPPSAPGAPDRSTPDVSLAVPNRIPSAYAGRAVPSGGADRPDHPAPAFAAPHDTQAVVASPLRFSCLAPRGVKVPLNVGVRAFRRAKQVEAPPARVIRGWCSSAARVPGPRPGCSRGLAGGAFVRLPGDARGICCNPSQCCPGPAGECASSASRAHLPFRPSIHREFHRRGTPLLGAGRRIAGPRLLGFGPGGQSCRALRRPRHGFLNRVDRARRPGLPWVLWSSFRCSVAGL